MAEQSEKQYIAADVGGTNTRLACAPNFKVHPQSQAHYKNADMPDFYTALNTYIAAQGLTDTDIGGICVDIAGPVVDGIGKLTNIDWRVETQKLRRIYGTQNCHILNDMQAQGYAITHLPQSAYEHILGDTFPKQGQTKLVVNIGTGFNAAPVYMLEGRAFVPSSEAGHCSLPVQTSKELALAQHLQQTHGFASVEEVLSGRAIAQLYRWLKPENAPISGADVLAAAHAQEPAAVQTVRIFCNALGTVCGDLALTHLSFGGIYLVGGVARAIAPFLADGTFHAALTRKGRFAHITQNISVYIVNDDNAALYGGAAYLQLWQKA